MLLLTSLAESKQPPTAGIYLTGSASATVGESILISSPSSAYVLPPIPRPLRIRVAACRDFAYTMAIDDIDATTLMPLDTPVLKVSRPVAACSRCRNAKIKCDGKLPVSSFTYTNGPPSSDT